MREIKFRAWDEEYKEWITDTLLFYPQSGHVFNTKRRFTEEKNDENVILQQFTGLKDKNGKEIYEGDLLKKKDADKPRVVKWTDQNGAYFVLSNSATKKVDWDDCLTDEHIKIFEYEVIGDTYSNPELLN